MDIKRNCFLVLAIGVLVLGARVEAASPTQDSSTSRLGFEDAILKLPDAIKHNRVKIDFNNITVLDLVKTIAKMTKKNFIVDPKVRGRITIIGPAEVTVQAAYYAFLTSLKMNNLTIIPEPTIDSQGTIFLRITTERRANKSPIPVYTSGQSPPSSNYVTQLFRLKYLDLNEVRSRLSNMVTHSGRMIAFPPDTLIITDTGANIRRITTIIKALDIRGFHPQIAVVPVKNATVTEMAEKLDAILEEGSTSSRGGRRSRKSRGSVSSKRTFGGGIIQSIIPYERNNSLIVVANKRGLREVKLLLAQLDTPEPSGHSSNFHVYRCRYANAEELAKTLTSMLSGVQSRTSRARSSVRAGSRARAARAGGSTFEGEIKVTADKPTNSVVITATKNDFQNLQRGVLAQLDVPRLQVFVESVFLEVFLTDTLDWELSTNVSEDGLPRAAGFVPNAAGLVSLLSNDAAQAIGGLTGFIIGKTFGGKKVTINAGGKDVEVDNIQALLKFLITNNFGNVLSRPTLLVMDNEEGTINIKDKTPSVGSTTVGVNGNVQSIKEVETGIQLKITPQINPDTGYVRLKLDQSVSEPVTQAVPAGLAATNVGVSSREAQTTVVVENGQTVVIGGLIRDKDTDARKKVPFVGDIPILGWLFKSSDRDVIRSNLLLLVTPHVVMRREDADRLRKNSLLNRKNYIREYFGGKDIFENEARNFYNNDTYLSQPLSDDRALQSSINGMGKLNPLIHPHVEPTVARRPQSTAIKTPEGKRQQMRQKTRSSTTQKNVSPQKKYERELRKRYPQSRLRKKPTIEKNKPAALYTKVKEKTPINKTIAKKPAKTKRVAMTRRSKPEPKIKPVILPPIEQPKKLIPKPKVREAFVPTPQVTSVLPKQIEKTHVKVVLKKEPIAKPILAPAVTSPQKPRKSLAEVEKEILKLEF